jgi:hypothetical protein
MKLQKLKSYVYNDATCAVREHDGRFHFLYLVFIVSSFSDVHWLGNLDITKN